MILAWLVLVGWCVVEFLGGISLGAMLAWMWQFTFYFRALRWHFKGFLLTTLTLNNHHRLFAGEQLYAFILSLYTLGRQNVKMLISSRIIRSLSFRNLKPVDHPLLFYFLLFDLMRSGEFIPCGV
jgi:hypothetical protein